MINYSSTTVLNNILLLITRSRLSITQASSSFKRFNTRTFAYQEVAEICLLPAVWQILHLELFVNICFLLSRVKML